MLSGKCTRDDGVRTWWWIGVAICVSVLMRLRMLSTPINADEGGYLAIARAWGHGRGLYRDVWVDRPQGLLGLFRLWDWLSRGHTSSIRVMAMLFGALLVVSTALVVWQLFGHVAARWAALICAVLSATPVLEGYMANGELLSGAVATTGLAVSVIGLGKPRIGRWMFAAGLLAGVALSLKQSGFDGLMAMLLWLAIRAATEPDQRRRSLRAAMWLGAGAATVIGVLLAHAASIGWQRWWWAIGGYRSSTLSLLSHPNWSTLRHTARYGALVLGPSLLLGMAGLAKRIARRAPRSPGLRASRHALVMLWLGTASFAFMIGGGYWRHYWLLLVAPISALAGVAAATMRRVAVIAVAVAVTPALLVSLWVFAGNPSKITWRAASDHQSVVDERVARWYLANRRAGDQLYVMCGRPAVYADVHQDPPVPYLWFPEVIVGPQASQRLLTYLIDTPPTYIAKYNTAGTCDRSGRVQPIIDRSYAPAVTIDGITILRRHTETSTLDDRIS